jgi:hypothetical protein
MAVRFRLPTATASVRLVGFLDDEMTVGQVLSEYFDSLY